MGETILGRILREARGVIHVGAASGQEAQTYAERGLAVTWIEAIPKSYERLLSNIRGFPRQVAVNALITDRDGEEREFYVASNDGDSSSIFAMDYHLKAWPAIRYEEVVTLRTRTLDSLLAEGRFTGHDAMVLDLQGAELLALRGAERLLRQIRFVQSEAYGERMYAGGATARELIDFLEQHGFIDAGTISWTGRTTPDGAPYLAYQLAYAKGA